MDGIIDGLGPILERLARLRADVDALEYQIVDLLRVNGVTWETIGATRGVTPQAAQKRWQKTKRHHR